MTSRLPPAFAATEYSLSLGSDHTHDRAPDPHPRPDEPSCRPLSALTLRPAINYGRERHRFGINSTRGRCPRAPPLGPAPRTPVESTRGRCPRAPPLGPAPRTPVEFHTGALPPCTPAGARPQNPG